MKIFLFLVYLILFIVSILAILIFKPLFLALLYKWKYGDKIIIQFSPVLGVFALLKQSMRKY